MLIFSDPQCQDDLWMMAGDNNHQMGRKVYDKLTETYKFDLEVSKKRPQGNILKVRDSQLPLGVL